MTVWKPIDTAPHDFGKPITTKLADDTVVIVEWNEAWGYQGWFVVGEVCRIVEPTEWLAP